MLYLMVNGCVRMIPIALWCLATCFARVEPVSIETVLKWVTEAVEEVESPKDRFVWTCSCVQPKTLVDSGHRGRALSRSLDSTQRLS